MIVRNPLVLSGLVLASSGPKSESSRTPPTVTDAGLLTGEVIAGLPLAGLDLAVLSACETGLGTVAGGEGVFGLQRAFHLAGARTVIASLWSVEAGATRTLMTEFYKNLRDKKLSKLEALRQAQRTLMTDYTWIAAKGLIAKRQNSPAAGAGTDAERLPPFFWAGFVLSGDWR